MEYRYGSHTVFQIEYHFVWVTKYRYKVLTGEVAERVRELVRETCEAFEIRIVKWVVSKDHVHILTSCPPNMAPSEIYEADQGADVEQAVWGISAFEEEVLGPAFFGRGGYFCVTVGQMTEEMIKQYLEHHFEPKPNDDFKMESE